MENKKMVSIKVAVDRAIDDMGDRFSKDMGLMISWAARAEDRIASYYQYKRNIHVLDVDECRAILPDQTVMVRGIRIGDHGCECGSDFEYIDNLARTNSHYGYAFLGNSADASRWGADCFSKYRWEVQDNCIVFSSGTNFDKVTVQTLDYETDSQGLIKVNRTHLEAITAYIVWKNKARSRWNKTDIAFSLSEVDYAKREWERLCANARARDGRLTESQRSEIVAMINDPISGVGMRFDSDYFNGWL